MPLDSPAPYAPLFPAPAPPPAGQLPAPPGGAAAAEPHPVCFAAPPGAAALHAQADRHGARGLGWVRSQSPEGVGQRSSWRSKAGNTIYATAGRWRRGLSAPPRPSSIRRGHPHGLHPHALPPPPSQLGVIIVAMGLIATGYIVVGTAGYAAFPASVSSNILNTFPPDDIVMQVRRGLGEGGSIDTIRGCRMDGRARPAWRQEQGDLCLLVCRLFTAACRHLATHDFAPTPCSMLANRPFPQPCWPLPRWRVP